MLNKKLDSPFLIKYHSIFSEREKTYVFMEFCGRGDLDQFVKAPNTRISSNDFLNIFAQMVMGIAVLHKNKTIHCDIKPQNMLLNDENELKISDFGIAKPMAGTLTMNAATAGTGVAGTIGFIPAEVICGKPHTPASDIFAAGCTMYFVATGGHLPFEAPTPLLVPGMVVEGRYPPIARADIADEAKTLVYRMLDKSPSTRPTVEDLLGHPLLAAAIARLPTRKAVLPGPDMLGGMWGGGAGAGTTEQPPLNVDLPLTFRPNASGGVAITHTVSGEQCAFTVVDDRTVFLNTVIAEGIYRLTVKYKYVPNRLSHIWIGAAPVQLLAQCDSNYLGGGAGGGVKGTCSLSSWRSVNGALHSRLSGAKDREKINEQETLVPDGAVVAAEIDADLRILSFFVNDQKVPHAFFNVPLPLYLGVSGKHGPSFTALSFRRLPLVTQSPVKMAFYQIL